MEVTNIIPGVTNRSLFFAMSSGSLDITDMKLGYIRWNEGDGTSVTEVLSSSLVALATITTAHTDNRAIFLDSDATGGNQFILRVDFPDAAFATGKDSLVCNVYDSFTNVVAHRVLSLDPRLQNYGGKVWYDATASNTNTLLGEDGLPTNKVSTAAAAIAVVPGVGTRLVNVVGTMTLTQSWNDVADFEGTNLNSIINLNGQDAANNVFSRLLITGSFSVGGNETVFSDCTLLAVDNLAGVARDCIYSGACSIADIASEIFVDKSGSTREPMTLDMTGANRDARFHNWSGDMTLTAMTTVTGDLEVILSGGSLTLASGCTSGNVKVSGFGTFVDNSSGTTVDQTGLGLQHWTGVDLIGTGANMIENDGGVNKRWTSKSLEEAPDTPGGDATLANQTTLLSEQVLIKAKTDNLPHSIKRSTALSNFPIQMFDTNGDPLGAANPVVIQIMKDGVAYADTANTPATFVSDGTFKINFTSGDLSGIANQIKATAVGARPSYYTLLTEQT